MLMRLMATMMRKSIPSKKKNIEINRINLYRFFTPEKKTRQNKPT